jgi:hypothetical protein
MENKGLIFIPDISSFTRFVNEMEIGHSRTIIQELLEILINANRIGMRCRCILENGESSIYSSSFSFHPERIEFTETDEVKKSVVHYLLEKTGENKTRLTLTFYTKKNSAAEIIFKLTKKNKWR